jgi:hypothetical protein
MEITYNWMGFIYIDEDNEKYDENKALNILNRGCPR